MKLEHFYHVDNRRAPLPAAKLPARTVRAVSMSRRRDKALKSARGHLSALRGLGRDAEVNFTA